METNLEQPDGEQAGAGDPVKQWLTESGRLPATKARQISGRLAMERAIAQYREIAQEASAEELSEAYIRLVIGRGRKSARLGQDRGAS